MELSEYLTFANGRTSPPRSDNSVYPVYGANGPIGNCDTPNFSGPAIVIGRVGSYCGNVQYVCGDFWATDNTIVATPLNSDEGYYWKGFLKNFDPRRLARGSGQPLVTQADLKQITVNPPPRSIRVALSQVLGSLDDKIAANHRVIQTSVELAESLVTRSLTTGYARLSDVAKVTMGTSPKGEFLSEEITGLPFYQGVRDFGEITPHQRIYTENPVREAEPGDILFAVRAPVGEVNIASEHTAIGRGLAAIRGVEHHNALFYLLRSRPEIWNMHQGSGTVFASINKTDLANASIPEIEMDSTDSALLDELHREALTLTNQNITLAKTRDELLPLLMSAKITVREAGQEAATAGAQIPSEENEV